MNSELISNLSELLKNASDKECQEIAEMLSNLNVNNRNEMNVRNFAEKIINKENKKETKYIKLLESFSVNALITAPTQVGKSAATREFIEACLSQDIPVIVSTDNKKDQCEQLYSRIKNDLCGKQVTMMQVSNKQFNNTLKKCLKNDNKKIVIFCLDNSSQISKLIDCLKIQSYEKGFKTIKKIALIHDEADIITKDKDILKINEDQAESHQKWLELVEFINLTNLNLKRVFVTATPENICMLYNLESPDLIKLEIPSSYTGYKDIEYKDISKDDNIKEILQKEVKRIKGDLTNEIILYCIDRKIINGQDDSLWEIAENVDCIVNTYNGNGIAVIINDIKKRDLFRKELKSKDIDYYRDENYFAIRDLSIRKFYTICKKIGENCVITIGKDLISRGISYVSEDEKNPMTASIMIYRPGMALHCCALTQTIGRITGCAMPSLKRRLYAPKEVIETYISYNKNQERYIKEIQDTKDMKLTKDIIKQMTFEKIKRSVDRKKLELKMNMKKEEQEVVIDEMDRMKDLVNMWWGKISIIGKILKFVYDNENGVNEKDLKELIEECGSKDVNKMYHHLTTKTKEYTLVFERKNNITNLKQEAREYIDEL